MTDTLWIALVIGVILLASAAYGLGWWIGREQQRMNDEAARRRGEGRVRRELLHVPGGTGHVTTVTDRGRVCYTRDLPPGF